MSPARWVVVDFSGGQLVTKYIGFDVRCLLGTSNFIS